MTIRKFAPFHLFHQPSGHRLFQRREASATVVAVGPNVQHFLQVTNFGSRSLLTQRSEQPQNGHGRNGPADGMRVIAELLLGQLMGATWAASQSGFVQRIDGSQARSDELAVYDPFGTALDISEPQPDA